MSSNFRIRFALLVSRTGLCLHACGLDSLHHQRQSHGRHDWAQMLPQRSARALAQAVLR